MKKRADGLYQLTETFNGKRKTFYGKTIAECKRKRDEYVNSSAPENITFEIAYKRYKQVEAPRISESAYSTKCDRIEYFSELFPVKLDAVTPQMIAVLINKLAIKNPKTKKPSAKRTLKRYLSAVSNVYEYAISERLTTYNPCRYVRIPQNAPQIDREALLPEEYQIILDSNKTEYLAAQIMILCGLRRGELAALTWADVTDVITVNKSYDYKAHKLKPPKTSSGVRTVPVPDILRQKLQPEKHKPTDYVIGGKQMICESKWYYIRRDMIQELGFEFSWHQLRHTYATILYDAGVDVLSAQKFLGHANINMTLGVYTSLSEKRRKDSIESLNQFLA